MAPIARRVNGDGKYVSMFFTFMNKIIAFPYINNSISIYIYVCIYIYIVANTFIPTVSFYRFKMK